MSLVSSPFVPFMNQGGSALDDDLDFETSSLIAKLALEDLDELLQAQGRRSNVGPLLADDEDMLQLQREHYQQLLVIIEDARLATSIEDAVRGNGPHMEALLIAEVAAADDRRAAEMLSRGEDLPPPTAAQSLLEDPHFFMHSDSPIAQTDVFDDLAWSETDSIISDFNHIQRIRIASPIESISEALKSIRDPSPVAGPSVDRRKMVECTICYDHARYMDSLQAPCGHYYCQNCTLDLVETFTRDESLFPLRCCQQPILVNDVIPFLPYDIRVLFEEKNGEYSVSSADRIYCVNPTCSKFLGSSSSTWSIICPSCGTTTCPECKQASHESEDCPVNVATVRLHALAEREGWQICPGCHALVELNLGCYHMVCRCRTQFCYLCGDRWKTCQCPQFEEDRLLNPAQQRGRD